jgi:hypothetical protein
MGFQKFAKSQYPRRQWLIEGEPDTGKSTFVTQMRRPILPIDADQRFAEVVHLAGEEVYQLSDNPADNISVDRIAEILYEQMPGSDVGTIAIDSLTTIFAPLVMQAIRGNEQGRNKNRVAAFKEKATAIRLLQDVVTGWGTDTAWIYHLVKGRDAKANEVVKTSITELELSRIMRSVNLRLRLSQDNGVYKAEVVWARCGRCGVVLEDTVGYWKDMPEMIEAAVYDGLSEADMDRLEAEPPELFPSPVEAIRWGMDQVDVNGQPVFKDEAHAQNAYEKVRREKRPRSAREMRDAWVEEVTQRKERLEEVLDAAA